MMGLGNDLQWVLKPLGEDEWRNRTENPLHPLLSLSHEKWDNQKACACEVTASIQFHLNLSHISLYLTLHKRLRDYRNESGHAKRKQGQNVGCSAEQPTLLFQQVNDLKPRELRAATD